VDSQTFEYRNENRSPYGALAAAGLVGDGKEKNHATTGMAPFWWRAWGDAVLTTFWTVSDKDSSSPVMKRKSVFRAPVSATADAPCEEDHILFLCRQNLMLTLRHKSLINRNGSMH